MPTATHRAIHNLHTAAMINNRLKEKLKFQAWHRGTRENDLLLGPFADDHLPCFSPAQLALFQQFLEESDLDIFRWIVHKVKPPIDYKELVNNIIQYHATR